MQHNSNLQTSLNATALRMEERFLALSILASRM